MRRSLFFGLGLALGWTMLTGFASAQALTEFGAAAAGSTAGAAGGKAVSNGIDHIFGRVNGTMNKAAGTKTEDKTKETKPAPAKTASADPAMKVGPGAPKAAVEPDNSDVPPPPATAAERAAEHPAPVVTRPEVIVAAPPPPPPPSMTPDELKQVTQGMARAEVLKMGAPASRITMFEDGHLTEIYSYRQNGERFGVVKLQDGSVASVQNR